MKYALPWLQRLIWMHTCTLTSDTQYIMLIHTKKKKTHPQIQTYPCPHLSSSLRALSHLFLFGLKGGTSQMIKRYNSQRGERTTLCPYKATFRTTFSIFLVLMGKGSFTFVLIKNLNVRFLWERQRPGKIKETEQALCFFLEAELFQTMMA